MRRTHVEPVPDEFQANLRRLTSAIETKRDSLSRLQHRERTERQTDEQALRKAYEELQTMFEELVVTEEEMRQQYEAMVESRHMREVERQRYRDLFEFAPDGYLVTDLDGAIREANRSAGVLLNLDPARLIRKPLALYVVDEQRKAFRQRLLELQAQEQVFDWEVLLQPRRGEVFAAALSVAVVRDTQGSAVGLRWMIRDVTAKKRAEQQIQNQAVRIQDYNAALEQEKRLLEQRVHERTEELEAANALKEQILRREMRALDRLAFLSEGSRKLSVSLDYWTTLGQAATLPVPFLADWCVIDVFEEGQPPQTFAAHVEHEKTELIRAMRARFPVQQNGGSPVMKTWRTGQIEFAPEVNETVTHAQSEEHRRFLNQLGMGSYIVMPLQRKDRRFGTIAYVYGFSHRHHTKEDLVVAEEYAQRASVAIENARLFRVSRDEIAMRRRIERELGQKQASIEALNQRLQRAMVETHHRVKNNLQIVAALIDMRLMESEATISVAEFKRLNGYITTLATIHDILTHRAKEDGVAEHISATDILEKLLPNLALYANGADLQVHLDDALLTARQGTSMAIIANELISNAMKHGEGHIEVRFTVQNGTAELSVNDDGPGFSADFDPARRGSTGLELVENLTRIDLNGQIRYENRPEGGAHVALTFPISSRLDHPIQAK